MTLEQIDYMTQSGVLFLNKNRRKDHFDPSYTLRQLTLIPIVLFFVFIIKDGTGKLGTLTIICTVMTLILLSASYLIFKSQQSKLKLICFDTGLSKTDNYMLAKNALDVLKWTVKEDSLNFIEAYNPNRDIRTWGNEMVSIVLLDNKILLNSICNLNAMNQVGFTFGKNRENIEKFIDMFELLAQNRK